MGLCLTLACANADMMHHSSWETVIEDVNAFLDSGCLTPSLQAGRPLASWILQHVDQLKAIHDLYHIT